MEKILSSFDHISERVHKILGSFYSLKCLLIRAPSIELWLCSAVLRTSLLGPSSFFPCCLLTTVSEHECERLREHEHESKCEEEHESKHEHERESEHEHEH